MAVYAATVTLAGRGPKRIGAGLAILRGTVDVTNYNQTLAAITGITGKFKGGNPTVIMDGISDNGYVVRWDTTTKSVKAYYGSPGVGVHNHDMLFIGGIATTEAVMIASGDTLGKNAATNRTIANAAYATKGGVVPSATAVAAASTQVASDVDVGAVSFIAVGVI